MMGVLPGLSGIIAGVGVLTALTFDQEVHDTSGMTSDLAVPSNTEPGDLLVMVYRAVNNSVDPPDFDISGWEKVGTFTNSDAAARHTYFWRISDGADADVALQSGHTSCRRGIVLFKGNRPIIGVNASALTSEASTGNPSSQVQSSGTGPAPMIVFGSWVQSQGDTTVSPRTMSPAKDQEIRMDSTTSWNWFGWRVINLGASLADTTVDMDDEGSDNMLASFTLRPY